VRSSPERELGALAHRLRHIERAHDQFGQRLSGQRLQIDVELVNVREKFRIGDRRFEGFAQHGNAIGGNSRRRDQAAADRAAARIKLVNLPVLRRDADFRQGRRVGQLAEALGRRLQEAG